jgi:predicted transcriptional regulator
MDENEERSGGAYRLNKNERRGIERGLDAMRQGRFASDAEIAAILAKARSSSESKAGRS